MKISLIPDYIKYNVALGIMLKVTIFYYYPLPACFYTETFQ